MFSDLHAHYPMDTGSGMKLYDEKSDENHGKLYGDIKWVEVSDSYFSNILRRISSNSTSFCSFRALLLRNSNPSTDRRRRL